MMEIIQIAAVELSDDNDIGIMLKDLRFCDEWQSMRKMNFNSKKDCCDL